MKPKMNAQEVEQLILAGFENRKTLCVEEVQPGYVRARLPFRESMLRPGRVLSGPALFTAADLAMYALVLSHVGPQLMAVTANFNINFLSKGEPGDIIAECRALKFGRRLVVMEASLHSSADPDTAVAHVTGSYALPAEKPGGISPAG